MRKVICTLLMEIVDLLRITDGQRMLAEKSYNKIGDWLKFEDSRLSKYDISVFPQGSIKLGTLIKPIDGNVYDIDVVCQLSKNIDDISAYELKDMIGNRLKQNQEYRYMIKEKKRCWTLIYNKHMNYHIDILPAMVNVDYGLKATEKKGNKEYIFIDTSPHEYGEWFKERMNQYTRIIYERGEIEVLPQYPHKTSLQMAIMLFKRYRDVMFIKDLENKPISIILTTLSALSYNSEIDLVDAIENILDKCNDFIEVKDGFKFIPNPVNPKENFADKWINNIKLEENYYKMIDYMKNDFKELFDLKDVRMILNKLNQMFDYKVVNNINE